MADLNPQDRIRQTEELSDAGQAQVQQTRAQLEKLDTQIAGAPAKIERLQSELHTVLLDSSESSPHEREPHALQDRIRRTEQLAKDRQTARDQLGWQYQAEQVTAKELRLNVTRAHDSALWHEFQATLAPLDATLRQAEVAWTTCAASAQHMVATPAHLGGSDRASSRLAEIRAQLARAREGLADPLKLPHCRE